MSGSETAVAVSDQLSDPALVCPDFVLPGFVFGMMVVILRMRGKKIVLSKDVSPCCKIESGEGWTSSMRGISEGLIP